MLEARIPDNEADRLAALRDYEVLDTPAEAAFDDLTRLAARLCGVPIALVSLVDEQRQWFKSKVGLAACETPRRVAFCSHAILESDRLLVVEDALRDERFADNPLATGDPHVRFYAGAPLVEPGGHALGTLCVIDHQPRTLEPDQLETLRLLARQVVSQLELHRACRRLADTAEQLHRSNRELADFNRVAAHDLQEPLRKLVSFSGLLRGDLGRELPEAAVQDLAFIEDAAQRMNQLVRDLLRLSETGSGQLNRQPVPLGACVSAALDTLAARIAERSAQIEVPELPVVEGDRTLLTQLFQNLLSNALKFADEAPHIRITCEPTDRGVIVGVQDNGIGIARADAERVFAPFQRLHGRDRYRGSGIGLSIARRAVERHHGSIWVESEPGRGSHFRFELPAARRIEICPV